MQRYTNQELSKFSVVETFLKLLLMFHNLTDLGHQMGPSINNLVPAIHDGHLKKTLGL